MANKATFKAAIPSQHHTAFDAEMAKCPSPSCEAAVSGFLQQLIALLKQLGGTINYSCIIKCIPIAIAAFSSGDWASVLVAYMACAADAP